MKSLKKKNEIGIKILLTESDMKYAIGNEA